jgi:hypothetical protein
MLWITSLVNGCQLCRSCCSTSSATLLAAGDGLGAVLAFCWADGGGQDGVSRLRWTVPVGLLCLALFAAHYQWACRPLALLADTGDGSPIPCAHHARPTSERRRSLGSHGRSFAVGTVSLSAAPRGYCCGPPDAALTPSDESYLPSEGCRRQQRFSGHVVGHGAGTRLRRRYYGQADVSLRRHQRTAPVCRSY